MKSLPPSLLALFGFLAAIGDALTTVTAKDTLNLFVSFGYRFY
jgi:hypothetical protein